MPQDFFDPAPEDQVIVFNEGRDLRHECCTPEGSTGKLADANERKKGFRRVTNTYGHDYRRFQSSRKNSLRMETKGTGVYRVDELQRSGLSSHFPKEG
jgi:hypothetical protein